ncbi:MAG: peptidase S24 [Verrucomicrobia bacterium CG_4_10_14_3_um_filter_43_23]|nr:MAG: hypothetical protein AUJ82_03945 [Verrucomicrobia bacterium CG1_02_43_26]PIP58501.1 MAG: peptidase S24 [Verrucomicrobia bacterium CG22_combo_CG10-13_8_21_14_all_43_17]PIX58174.1 MAG: peptidase S24 [Verrucomicrobia bacterium CG_4_10_14_3_um_filter_43_23]PIY60983.1 MAG: peptidase S24 [Verrucomicrobia bacterium CG_4_10_14_0_8_um_filter_43_34]PJA43381.1 MAG: peptidase S24 [Verrucomicrobia bacterium CG_4_9_14_3_um_filter_43_20]
MRALPSVVSTSSSSSKIPFMLSCVQAGFSSPASDHYEQALDLHELTIKHPEATFFVRVSGESMRDAGIYPDDILIVDRSLSATSGNIVIAIINDEFTVKRLVFHKQKWFLKPENASFPAIEINGDNPAQIWGVVTFAIHNVYPNA